MVIWHFAACELNRSPYPGVSDQVLHKTMKGYCICPLQSATLDHDKMLKVSIVSRPTFETLRWRLYDVVTSVTDNTPDVLLWLQ